MSTIIDYYVLKWAIESKPESKPYYIHNNTGGHNE